METVGRYRLRRLLGEGALGLVYEAAGEDGAAVAVKILRPERAEDAAARARVDAEGRIRRAEEEVGRLEEQSRARLHALEADMAAIADQRRDVVDDVRRIAGRLAELVGELEPPTAAVAEAAPETNGAEPDGHGPPA